MINIQFDTSGIDKFVKSLDRKIKDLRRGQREYLDYLLNSCNVQADLEHQIIKEVYSKPLDDNSWYKRTENLLKSAKVEIRGEEIHIFIDNQWLGQQHNANYTSIETGTATEAHRGSYELQVEKGWYYNNRIGNPYKKEARPFMQKTFEELERKIMGGEYSADKILEPLIKGWAR